MAKRLKREQLKALRAVPLGDMPNKVKLALALTGAKQQDICEEKDIPPSVLSTIATGKTASCMLDTAQKIADFFGCTTDDIFPARETTRVRMAS